MSTNSISRPKSDGDKLAQTLIKRNDKVNASNKNEQSTNGDVDISYNISSLSRESVNNSISRPKSDGDKLAQLLIKRNEKVNASNKNEQSTNCDVDISYIADLESNISSLSRETVNANNSVSLPTLTFFNKVYNLSIDMNKLFKFDKFHKYQYSKDIFWQAPLFDALYVAVIYKIDLVISDCGNLFQVYVLASTYLVLAFYTKLHFDKYASYRILVKDKSTSYPLLQGDIFHHIMCILYGLSIVIMTINMATVPSDDLSSLYGYCKVNKYYSYGIGISIIMSKILLMTCYVFVRNFICHKNLLNGSFINNDLKIIEKKVIFHFFSIIPSIALFIFPRQILFILPFVVIIDVINDWFTNFPGQLHFLLESNATKLCKDVINFHISTSICLDTSQKVEFMNNDSNEINKVPFDREENVKGYIISHAEVVLEKLGSLVILVLGETVIALLFSSYNTNELTISYLSIIFSYFLIVSLAIMVYESVVQKEIIEHQFHPIIDGDWSSCIFTILHCTLCISLIVSTSGLEYLYHQSTSEDNHSTSVNSDLEDENRFKLAMGLGVALIIIWLLSLCHLSLKKDFINVKLTQLVRTSLFTVEIFYVIIGLLHIFAYYIPNTSTDGYIVMQLFISIALNSIRLIYRLKITAADNNST